MNDQPETNPELIKEQICDIGRRIYNRSFAAANDGNISVRIAPDRVLCSPTMICKGFMSPDDICTVDLEGNQISGKRKRTSEILLHLAIMKAREDVQSVVHCHPPHATAFAIAHEPIPKCILPEVEVFLGEVPVARYETPGTQKFADSILPFVHGANTIILANHGTVSFGHHVEQAYWFTEILDSYCHMLLLAKQLGPIHYFTQQQTRELLEMKRRLGFSDPRIDGEDMDLSSDTVFREGYCAPRPNAFFPDEENNTPHTQARSSLSHISRDDLESLVREITQQVISGLKRNDI